MGTGFKGSHTFTLKVTEARKKNGKSRVGMMKKKPKVDRLICPESGEESGSSGASGMQP
jgi:hypothetical protein